MTSRAAALLLELHGAGLGVFGLGDHALALEEDREVGVAQRVVGLELGRAGKSVVGNGVRGRKNHQNQ